MGSACWRLRTPTLCDRTGTTSPFLLRRLPSLAPEEEMERSYRDFLQACSNDRYLGAAVDVDVDMVTALRCMARCQAAFSHIRYSCLMISHGVLTFDYVGIAPQLRR